MFNADGNLIKTNTTGVAIKVPTSSAVNFHFKTPAGISSYQNIVGGSSFKYYAMGLYAVKFLDYDASLLDTQSVAHGDPATFPVVNKEEYSV